MFLLGQLGQGKEKKKNADEGLIAGGSEKKKRKLKKKNADDRLTNSEKMDDRMKDRD